MENFSSELVEYYDEFQASLFDYAKEAEIISNTLRSNSAKSVIDIGCGTGTHLIYLAKKGYKCTGVDINRQMLRVAERKAERSGVQISLIEADIKNGLMLQDCQEEFDASICIRSTLSSTKDVQLALESQHRILRPKGIIVFDILHPDNDYEGEALNMDVIGQDNVAVRFNNFNIRYPKIFYQSVCFVQTKENTKIIPNSLELIMMELRNAKQILESVGFEYNSVIHEYRGIPKTKCLFILARKIEV